MPQILSAGVNPTGILEDIPPSGIWRPVEKPERPDLELGIFEEPWGSAVNDPECLMQLVEADVAAGFADWLPGGLSEARARFGSNCAAGRLGLVKKAGSDPRLIGDSSVSHANHLCRIQEKVELPSLQDVTEFTSRQNVIVL